MYEIFEAQMDDSNIVYINDDGIWKNTLQVTIA